MNDDITFRVDRVESTRLTVVTIFVPFDAPVDEVQQAFTAARSQVEPDFECPAYISHGPGHQSRAKCEIRIPHPIDGEHWARDPMCPDFEWTGAKGSTGF